MITSVAIIAGYAIFYGILHSWTASRSMKDRIRRVGGTAVDRWYRLAYNVVGTVLLLPFVPMLLWLPDRILYTMPMPWFWLALLAQAAALVGIVYGVALTDAWQFLGLRQLDPLPSDVPPRQAHLVLSGPYRWVRHPLYFFGLIMIWLTPQMTINRLTLAVVLSIYLYVGTFFEERRLIDEFGAAYEEYRREVPRLLPIRFGRR